MATLHNLFRKMPRFMLDPGFDHYSEIFDTEHLLSHVRLQIDQAVAGELHWTAKQMHAAKMYAATLHIAPLDEKGDA